MTTAVPFAPPRAVRGAMSSPVHAISAETTVVEALDRARRWNAHHLPVTDAGEVIGVLCTCDLRDVALSAPVARLIEKPAERIDARASCEEAARKMKTRQVGSLLVTDGFGLCGIVTRADLAKVDARGERILADVICVCCGSREHLHADPLGQLLCVDCRERADEPQHFESGGGD